MIIQIPSKVDVPASSLGFSIVGSDDQHDVRVELGHERRRWWCSSGRRTCTRNHSPTFFPAPEAEIERVFYRCRPATVKDHADLRCDREDLAVLVRAFRLTWMRRRQRLAWIPAWEGSVRGVRSG